VREALDRWRRRRPRKAVRVAWSLAFLAGYALWSWALHDWAAAHGYRGLLNGWRPWYFAVSAVTYWPMAGLLWWLVYPRSGLLPWVRE
jgi:hypothetical protein